MVGAEGGGEKIPSVLGKQRVASCGQNAGYSEEWEQLRLKGSMGPSCEAPPRPRRGAGVRQGDRPFRGLNWENYMIKSV